MKETELLIKYIEGNALQEEKEYIQLWLEADEKNMKEFLALRRLYDYTLTNSDEADRQSIIAQQQKIRRIFKEVIKLAAVVLLTFAISYLLLKATEEPEITNMQTLYVPAGQRAELMLADGTMVWLNAQSSLNFPSRFNDKDREVYLDGEGYFKVAKDKLKKFTVNTRLHNINVLGTEFNVSAYHKLNNFETSLLEGSLEVVSKKNNEKILLTPGQQIYIEENSLVLKPIVHQDYFLWKNGILSFEQERVGDILNKIRFIYDVDIQCYNKSLMDFRLTIKFHTKDGIEQAINVLKIATGLQYMKSDEKNLITIW